MKRIILTFIMIFFSFVTINSNDKLEYHSFMVVENISNDSNEYHPNDLLQYKISVEIISGVMNNVEVTNEIDLNHFLVSYQVRILNNDITLENEALNAINDDNLISVNIDYLEESQTLEIIMLKKISPSAINNQISNYATLSYNDKTSVIDLENPNMNNVVLNEHIVHLSTSKSQSDNNIIETGERIRYQITIEPSFAIENINLKMPIHKGVNLVSLKSAVGATLN